MSLQIDSLRVELGGQPILQDLSLSLPGGGFGCLLGPSGSGKSTLLRAVAGFSAVQAGHIAVGDTTLSRADHRVAPHRRGVGMVFQDLALLPHLTVRQNIAFGLFRWPTQRRHAQVERMLGLVNLGLMAERYPHELSGGQQQRVAVARALAPEPEVLLLDEPFSSLDIELRVDLAEQLHGIVAQTGTTTLMVTHDHHEAFAIADKVGVIAGGRLLQWDRPYALYHEPKSRFVASFVGEGVLLPGKVLDNGDIDTELGQLDAPAGPWSGGDRVEVLLRPDDIQHDDDSSLIAMVSRKAFRGAEFLYRLTLPSGQQVLSLVPSHHDHPLGRPIGIRLELDHVVVFPVRD